MIGRCSGTKAETKVDIKKGSDPDSIDQETNYIQGHINQERHNAIREICKALSCDASSFGLDQVKALYEQIRVYKETHIRWFYSDISNYIFGFDDPGRILSNIEELQEYADSLMRTSDSSVEIQNQAQDLTEFIDKLWDHASLAQQQKTAISAKAGIPDVMFSQKVYPKINEIENTIRKELISLIAIFTALSFIVFGGISSLDNIFEGAKSFPILQVLLIGCIWGLCMFNLIFLFVFFVSKLTGLRLSSTTDDSAKVSKKYPVWIWGNYIMLFILAAVALLYFIDYSNSGSWIITFAQGNPEKALLFGGGSIAFAFFIVALLII